MRFMVLGVLLACQGDVAETGQPGEPLEAVALPASIPTEGLSLEGELLLPDRWEGEPVMGVVLAHGSGPNGRDGTASGQLNMGFGFELDEVYRSGWTVLVATAVLTLLAWIIGYSLS